MTIDLILLGIILVFVIVGICRGFLITLLHLGATVVAYIGARVASQPVADFVYSNFLLSGINKKLLEVFPSGSIEGEFQTWIDSVIAQLPSGISSIAETFGFYPDVSAMFSKDTTYTVEMIEEQYIRPIVAGAVAILAMIVLFAIFTVILRIICKFIDKRLTDKDNHRFVNSINKLLGGLFGLLKGIIPAGIGACAINLVAPMINNDTFTTAVAESKICEFASNLF